MRGDERIPGDHPGNGLFRVTHDMYAGGGMPYAHSLAENDIRLVSHGGRPFCVLPCNMGAGRAWPGRHLLLCTAPDKEK